MANSKKETNKPMDVPQVVLVGPEDRTVVKRPCFYLTGMRPVGFLQLHENQKLFNYLRTSPFARPLLPGTGSINARRFDAAAILRISSGVETSSPSLTR